MGQKRGRTGPFSWSHQARRGHLRRGVPCWLYLLLVVLLLSMLLPATPVRAQSIEILKPTVHTISGGGTITNPASAYDGTTGGEDTTYNRLGVGDNNDDPTIEYHTWQSPAYTHSARRLYIRRGGTGNTDDTWEIHYSTDGGSNYTPIETGLTSPVKGNTTAVTIATGLNLSNLWVKISTNKSGSDDGGFADIWDVWLEGDYTPPSISNTPNSYGFGTVSEGSTSETGLTYFTVTNNGASSVTITVSGADMTGGVTWALSDTATPGTDTYGLKAGLDAGAYNIIVKKTTPYNILVSTLPSSSSQKWGLQLLAPTSFSDGGSKSGTVTLTATHD